MKKLTKPQFAVLEELAKYPASYSPSYSPIRRLEQVGLIKGTARKWGSWSYAITDAGREMLKRHGVGKA